MNQENLRSPKLAVVIPCFNYENYIGKAISSVTSQDCMDYEIVVIDDGSSDGSWDVISKSGVPAVRIANVGQRRACLHGVGLTSAPYVMFLDADDELRPGAIARIVNSIDDGVAKLQFSLTKIDEDGRVISHGFPRLANFRENSRLRKSVLKNGYYDTPPTTGNVFRRDVLKYLEEAEYDNIVDGVMLFVAPFLGDVLSINEDLAFYRIHHKNTSGLGKNVKAWIFERELRIFALRMSHLRTILRDLGYGEPDFKPEQTFYFLERSLYLAIVKNERLPRKHFLNLFASLQRQPYGVVKKFSFMLFLVALMISPGEISKFLINYRFKA